MGRRRQHALTAAAAGLTTCALVAGCGASAPERVTSRVTAPGVLAAAGVDRDHPRDAPIEEVVAGMTQLGYDLYGVSAVPDENIVLSPFSVASAFAMARAGARGRTAAELDAVFRYPVAGLHDAVNVLDQEIATADGAPPPADHATPQPGQPEPPAVAVANGLFAQKGFPLEPDFLEVLARSYGAGVGVVDFGSPSAKEIIDAWVQEQTADRIDELFETLPITTELVLANALYLKADWAYPFSEGATVEAPFTRVDGTGTQVPTMGLTRSLRYAAVDGVHVVELPYAASELAMWILVPTGDAQPADALSPAVLGSVPATFADTVVDLAMPRWDFETTLDLREPLHELGLVSPFSPAADFSALTPRSLFINQAIHRATITVDEWGTEAAAVTGIAFATSAPPTPEVKVRADRPFGFAIVHTPTGAPLFLGQVAEPTAS